MSPRVSILLSTYNEAKWLDLNIQSVLRQAYPHFEYFIIDDGSEDNTINIINNYSDTRLRVLHNIKRNGWRTNINKLAEISSGEIILILSPDDLLHSDCLSHSINFFNTHSDIGYFFTDFQNIDELGNNVKTECPAFPRYVSGVDADIISLRRGCIPRTSCTFFVKDKWAEQGGLREVANGNYRLIPTDEDWDLMIRLHRRYPVGHIPKRLVDVRVHPQQTHRNFDNLRVTVDGRLAVYSSLYSQVVNRLPSRKGEFYKVFLSYIAENHFHDGVKLLTKRQLFAFAIVMLALRRHVFLPTILVAWCRYKVSIRSRLMSRVLNRFKRNGISAS